MALECQRGDPKYPIYFTNQRLKITGHIIESFTYGNPILIGKRIPSIKEKNVNQYKKEYSDDEIRLKSLIRAKRRIIDLINTNQYEWKDVYKNKICRPIFLTLTFRDNIQDLNFANNEFTKLIKKFNYEILKSKKSYLKYISIVEFQKRGAIHYHIIFFNLPFIENLYDKLEKMWTWGFFNVKPVDKSENIGQYVSKYLTKKIDDDRLKTRKAYFISRNLIKPTIINIEELVNLLLKFIPKEALVYQREFESEYLSTINLKHYNLKKYPEAMDYVNELKNLYG